MYVRNKMTWSWFYLLIITDAGARSNGSISICFRRMSGQNDEKDKKGNLRFHENANAAKYKPPNSASPGAFLLKALYLRWYAFT